MSGDLVGRILELVDEFDALKRGRFVLSSLDLAFEKVFCTATTTQLAGGPWRVRRLSRRSTAGNHCRKIFDGMEQTMILDG